MFNLRTLNNLKPGEEAKVIKIKSDENIKRRLLDIGIVKGTKIKCLQYSLAGELTSFFVRGAVVAIREEDSKKIYIN